MLAGALSREGLKKLIVRTFNLDGVAPESINDDTPLFGDGLGLDSVDALELVVVLEKTYKVKITATDEIRDVFQSVATLSDYIGMLQDGSKKRPE